MVDGDRFRRVVEGRHGLLRHLFLAREHAAWGSGPDAWQRLAAVFAAKEACLKALGRGLWALGLDQALQEIEVVAAMPPRIRLHGATARRARARGLKVTWVSLSYSGRYCTAVVVMQRSAALDHHPRGSQHALLSG